MKSKHIFADLSVLAAHLRDKLETMKTILLYAYNGTGKLDYQWRLKTQVKKQLIAPFR